MSLVREQAEFLKDVRKLLVKAEELGFIVTGGELWRPVEMQKIYVDTGRSKTMDGPHPKRLGLDLNFFDQDLKLIYDREKLRPLGEYWEGLNTKNRWGGSWRGLIEAGKSSFKDLPHFERKI